MSKAAAAKAEEEESGDELASASEEEEEVEEKAQPNGGKKRSRASSAAPATPRKRAASVQPLKPKVRKAPTSGMNSLPDRWSQFPAREDGASVFSFEVEPLPAPEESPRTAFVCGNGDMGQHGMGDDDRVLCEIKRPRLHTVFEEKIAKEACWKGGIAQLECGGMHTLAIDGEGQVSRAAQHKC